MIQDLISNIIQNSTGNPTEIGKNLPASEQLKGEFSALLNSIKKESVSTCELFNKKMVENSDQSFLTNKESEESVEVEESILDDQSIKLVEVNQEMALENGSADLDIDHPTKPDHQIEIPDSEQNQPIELELLEIAISSTITQEENQTPRHTRGQINQNIELNKSSDSLIKSKVDKDILRQDGSQVSGQQKLTVQLDTKETTSTTLKTQETAFASESDAIITASVPAQQKPTDSTIIDSHPIRINVAANGENLTNISKEGERVELEKRSLVSTDKSQTSTIGQEAKDFSQFSEKTQSVDLKIGQSDSQKVSKGEAITLKSNEVTQLRPQVVGEVTTQFGSVSRIAQNADTGLIERSIEIPKIVQSATILNQIETSSKTQTDHVPIQFSEGKNPDLIQFIQTHKSEVIKPKDAKDQRFALSMNEQAETRLKLLVDSVRPELFSSREAPVGFITTHSLDEKIQFFNPSLTLNNDQEAMLKDFMMDSMQGKDKKAIDQNMTGYLRLSELPVANSTARRAIVSSFSKAMQQEMASSTNRQNEYWQKHSFKLDDGNNINMTSKNVDGLLHIKLAASNPELNRLLMSMEQEIKDHLKEELNLELDLQFDNQEQDAFSDASNDATGENRKNWNRNNSETSEEDSNQEAVKSLQPSIRNFGYNQMEWTA